VHGESGQSECGDIAQHVAGVSEERQGVRDPAGKGFDDHENGRDGQDEKQPALACGAQGFARFRAGVGMIPVVVMVRVGMGMRVRQSVRRESVVRMVSARPVEPEHHRSMLAWACHVNGGRGRVAGPLEPR
jgi:hypothetical protein